VQDDTKDTERLLEELSKLQQEFRTLDLRDTGAVERFRRKVSELKAKVNARQPRRDARS
jgi:hypothetical protein